MKGNNIVTVIGGLTIDLVYRVSEWPRINQAVQAKSYDLLPGGKGLNQATALARLGLNVQLLGSVGDDGFADMIFNVLRSGAVSTKNIIRQKNIPTDVIGVIVNSDGTPGFIGIRNATSKLTAREIIRKKHLIAKSSAVLINSEVDSSAILKALQIAKKSGVLTIFNPAPPVGLPSGVLKYVDYFVPNEWEAKSLLREKRNLSVAEMVGRYRKMGARNVIVTQGENGGVYSFGHGVNTYQAFPVREVDETGAGDAFIGSFIYGLLYLGQEEAIRFGAAAGALACLKLGARTSQPTLKAVNKFLKTHKQN